MNVRFIKPMESLAGKTLPTGEKGTYEVKLDGFRAVAVRTDQIVLYSRQGKVLTSQFIPIAQELEKLPPRRCLMVNWSPWMRMARLDSIFYRTTVPDSGIRN